MQISSIASRRNACVTAPRRVIHLTALLCIFFTGNAFTQTPQIVLGNPSAAVNDTNQPNNYLVIHDGYILSYNKSRGTANWVTWHLSGADIGDAERTNAFAADPLLPSEWRVKEDAYEGTPYDRGHLCPSEDRSDTAESNRESFLMSNMQPQLSKLNRGTWKSLEGYVQRLAKQTGMEAYLFAGCYGSGGKVNGKVTIPTHCWKIVVLLSEGNNDKRRINCSTRVIAVNMPNESSIKSGWRNYRTTVDDIENKTGYDFLSTLPKSKQSCLESKIDSQ
jgi:endonuclease G